MSNVGRYRREIRLFKVAYRQWFLTKRRFGVRYGIRYLTRRKVIL